MLDSFQPFPQVPCCLPTLFQPLGILLGETKPGPPEANWTKPSRATPCCLKVNTSMSMELAQFAWHHWLGFPGKVEGYPGLAWHRLAPAPGQSSNCPDRES